MREGGGGGRKIGRRESAPGGSKPEIGEQADIIAFQDAPSKVLSSSSIFPLFPLSISNSRREGHAPEGKKEMERAREHALSLSSVD